MQTTNLLRQKQQGLIDQVTLHNIVDVNVYIFKAINAVTPPTAKSKRRDTATSPAPLDFVVVVVVVVVVVN